jgi:IMP dehydrogenase/GMP reductase
VESKLNNRPRKCLGYKTPLEAAKVIMAGTTEATAYIAQGVPFRGSLAESVYQLVGGLRSGMGYCGADI